MEAIQEKKAKNMRSFEDLRFKNIAGLHSVVLEGHCRTCNSYIPVIIGNILEYLKAYVMNSDIGVRVDCDSCKQKNGLHFEIYPKHGDSFE
jgi:hypothetical protein